jgi:hypothetical protein
MQRGINELNNKKGAKQDKKGKPAERVLGSKRHIGNQTQHEPKKSYLACCPLQDNTRGARALASGGLDLESDLGRFVEAFSDTAILNSGAFCLPVSSGSMNT